MQIAIYSRKSRFTGKGESIENQIELCKRYVSLSYAEEEHETLVFEDEGYSGGHMDRPQFKAMLKAARDGKIQMIVCYRLDRISRNIGDFANLIEELNGMGVGFVSIKEQFDTSSPLGRAMMYIASVFSQLERETIAERIRDNMRELAKTGRWLGGIVPLGYSSEVIEREADGKIRRQYGLQPVEDEVKIVRDIFDIYLQEKSITKAELILAERGVVTKRGHGFSRLAIRSILSNPVYAAADEFTLEYFKSHSADVFGEEFDGEHGVMAYNKTIQARGRANKTRNMSEWIVAAGSHRGIISGEAWVQAQKQLALRRNKSNNFPRSSVALLSGILSCGSCGAAMRPKLTTGTDGAGARVYNYVCRQKEQSRGELCSMKNLSGNIADGLVNAEVKKMRADTIALGNKIKQSEARINGKSVNREIEPVEILLSWEDMFDTMELIRKRESIKRLTEQITWNGEELRMVWR